MLLEDLMADDVLLADTLNGEKLTIDHGAPLRLVAPAHYGYKNVKHIHMIEFWEDGSHFRFPLPYPNLMNHPRARVALEERVNYLPQRVVRSLYRLFMPFARRKQRRKLEAYLKRQTGQLPTGPMKLKASLAHLSI
jgi:DMSO/TMAO reductase YedYZ molybdopterin-dependent catalytic subunit